MKSGYGFAGRAQLIKADLITADIRRMYDDAPSEYFIGKSVLAKANSLFHSDLKKSVKLMEKARKEFSAEYSLAVQYIRITD